TGRNLRQAFSGFLVAFGLWDIFYYVFLKLLLGWPDSLLDWDVLFLLPVPWVGPVLAPVLVALMMMGAGAFVLWKEDRARPPIFGWLGSAGIVGGGIIMVMAFCWDYRNIVAGEQPNPFNWTLFALGGSIAAAAFVNGGVRGHVRHGVS